MKGILIKSAIALSLGVASTPVFSQTEQPAQGQSSGQSTDCPAGTECPQGGTQQDQQPDAQGGGSTAGADRPGPAATAS